MSDTARFLRDFVRDPLHTAAIAPSSRALAAAMTADLPDGRPVVVELGPGTGTFTAAIQARLRGRGRRLAVELNPGWAQLLRERYPGVEVVGGDVAELATILAEHDVGEVDAVVSGLPWVAYAGGDLHRTLATALQPEGVFTQFAYSWTRHWAPPARAQLADLRRWFADVTIGPTVWRNLPPAVVYRARRPRQAGDHPL